MKYATDDLMNEHEGILLGLAILEKIAIAIRDTGNIKISEIRELVDFFKSFADKCHHGKEEGLMFPAMVKAGIPGENGPVAQMLLEHNEGRGYIGKMSASIDEEDFRENDFIQAASNYISLMRAHIKKENTILFPLSNKVVPADVQKKLLKEFEEYEKNVMGKGVHERFHEMLHKLKAKYLE